MGKLSAALNAIFSTSGDAGLTSSMKVPYFKSKTIDGNNAFYPDGMASMSALASVLGGAYFGKDAKSIASGTNLNDILEVGAYYTPTAAISATIENAPTTSSAFVLWYISAMSGSNIGLYGLQVSFETTKGLSYRRHYGSGLWSKWINLPEFYTNYSTLAELKAALDALP